MKNPNVVISSDYGPIIININDMVIGKQIVETGYWDHDGINLIKSLIGKVIEKKGNATYYDIGANIGTHSLAIAKTFNTKVKIRAFEAQRPIFHMLCGTVAINGFNHIYCHNNAVSELDQELMEIELLNYDVINNFGAHELIPPVHSDNQNAVKGDKDIISTRTIDSFNEAVDIMKLDVEGMEDKVLKGAINTIKSHRPIIYTEIHKTDANFIIEFFRDIGNYIGFLKGINLVLIPLEYAISIEHSQRVL